MPVITVSDAFKEEGLPDRLLKLNALLVSKSSLEEKLQATNVLKASTVVLLLPKCV